MNKRRIVQKVLGPWIFAMLSTAGILAAKSPSPTSESMSGFTEAIRLEEQLSQESLEWNRQRRLLENEIEVLESELAETLRRVEAIQSDRTEIRERRETLLSRLAEEEELARDLSSLVSHLATPVQSLIGGLPRWSSFDPEAIEEITDSTPAVTLLRLLQELQAENSRVDTRPAEVVDPDSGETYRVDLLALGLGAGFFSSEDGSFAGRFVYDGEKWNPEIIPRYADGIRDAIRQEQGIVEPDLNDLPFSLETRR